MAHCPQRDELQKIALEVLQSLIDITKAQQEAVRRADIPLVESLDPKLETTFGKKERAFGALREHIEEHGCS
ncbi:MAG TPA: hypothetical protein VFT60_03725 [Bryobacteraceae bacterium]|jgi:hypothetical protein|nr:hypothetical protein [Bryobacteraceae bacterium]